MTLAGLAPLTVAAAQAEAVAGDVAGNAVTAADLVREGAAAGARVVVLPELFLPGYDMELLADDVECDVVDVEGDPRLEPLRVAGRETGTVAIVGASVRSGDRRTIGVLVVDSSGLVRHAYDKQHLLSVEARSFEPGRGRAVLTVDGWPLGLAVCYDGCFPEHARALADDGALAYVAPAAYVVGSEHRRDIYYAARALDNSCYVVLADLTGRCGAGVVQRWQRDLRPRRAAAGPRGWWSRGRHGDPRRRPDRPGARRARHDGGPPVVPWGGSAACRLTSCRTALSITRSSRRDCASSGPLRPRLARIHRDLAKAPLGWPGRAAAR